MAWDFKNNYVEPAALNADSGNYTNFISSESCLLVAGPPMANLVTDVSALTGIGLVEGVQISQQKNVNQLWEIGSRQSYFMPGRTMVQAQLSRVLFNGNNLMGAVYTAGAQKVFTGYVVDESDKPGITNTGTVGNFYVDLASSFFNKPFGLGIVIQDSEQDPVQIMYLENCNIISYQLGIQAQQLMVVDNMSIRCSRVKTVPYSVSTGTVSTTVPATP